MGKKIGILAVLVCLAIVAPALGNGVEVYGGPDGTIASPGAKASGGEFIKSTNDGIKATLAQWVTADVKVPDGKAGEAYAMFTDRSGDATTGTVNLNGEDYVLSTNYSDVNVNAGVNKESTKGVESANALVKTYVEVDNGFVNAQMYPCAKKNALYGYSQVSGNVSSTGTGTAYATAGGSAGYFADGVVCCTNPAKKAVSGVVSGSVDLEAVNRECICEGEEGCPCSTTAPKGTKSGSASVWTTSSANNYKSNSDSKLSLDMSAARTATGTSSINGYAYGNAVSMAWDGTTPQPWSNYAPNVRSRAEGDLYGGAAAYAAGDKATSTSYVKSDAVHNTDTNQNYNQASDEAYAGTTVKRTSSSCPANYAFAEAYIDDAFSDARSQENANSNQYAQETMYVDDMISIGQLQRINTISSNADLVLTATRDATANKVTNVNIKNVVNNNGPHSLTNNDGSLIYEAAGPLTASARSGSKYSAISVPTKSVYDLILGTNNPGGSPAIATTGAGTSQQGWNNPTVAFGPFNFVTNAGTYSGSNNIWKAKLDQTIKN
jgi:hypothetical protein